MTRRQLEHIIRAAAATADVRDIVVIGSQSILGQFPLAPEPLTASMEADVFPKDDSKRSIIIDGAIGEMSLFHQTFGYFAHGVDETTAILPNGWLDRLVKVDNANTMGAVGWCLEVHDLAISKLAAGRAKDITFFQTLFDHGLVSRQTLLERLSITERLAPELREAVAARIDRFH